MKYFKLVCVLSIVTMFFSCKSDDDNSGGTAYLNVSDFETTINENPAGGTLLGTITATTNQGAISYEFVSLSVANAFSLNTSTGAMTVGDASAFDYETNPTIDAVIEVTNGDIIKNVSVTITLNDMDDVAHILSSSLTSYNSASDAQWVEITEAEYNSLADNLNAISEIGIPDTLFESDLTNLSSGANNFTVAAVGGDANVIPSSSYLFAFKYVSGTTDARTLDEVKTGALGNSGFTTLGSALVSSANSGAHYFVLKNNTTLTTSANETSTLAFYSSKDTGYKALSGITNYYASGNQNTIPTSSTETINYMFQGLSTTQKQW